MKVKMILPALTEAISPFFRPIINSLFPPLGLATLAGYLDADDEVSLHDEHVTSLPDEAAPHADSIFLGPGEDIWPQFLADFRAGRPQPVYRSRVSGSTRGSDGNVFEETTASAPPRKAARSKAARGLQGLRNLCRDAFIGRPYKSIDGD
jgi:hypothetical protein